MIFGWLRKRRRQRILAEPVPANWHSVVARAIPWFGGWDATMRQRLLDNARIFMAEKNWEGCNGLEIDTEMQLVIAAQAGMMLVGIENYCFEGVQTLLVYPSSFRRETRQGMIVSETARIGEAWHRGPIVLSWADVVHVVPGRNVVVHELAHHLDGLDGDMGGSPVFPDARSTDRWQAVLRAGMDRLVADLDAGRRTFLDPYAATNQAEYFAVACEAFFELPADLRSAHPELYDCLTTCFQVDPARWQH